MSREDPGPGAGHQFHFVVRVQGSYSIGGDPRHYDCDPDTISEPFRLTVRAWSLPEACRIAARVSLSEWGSESSEAEPER